MKPMTVIRFTCLAVIICLLSFAAASAQNGIEAPDISTSKLAAEIEALDENDALEADDKTALKTSLQSTLDWLESASKNKQEAQRFSQLQEAASKTLSSLEAELEANAKLNQAPKRISDEPMREDTLIALEQELITKESALSVLRSELDSYEDSLQLFIKRQTAAPTELSQARTKLGELNEQITSLSAGKGEPNPIARAQHNNRLAQRYARQTQIVMLEKEIAALPAQQEIVTSRRTLGDLEFAALEHEVQYLQDVTGRRRANEAKQVKSAAVERLETYQGAHSIITDIATANIELADDFISLANTATFISKRSAAARTRLDSLEGDLRVAEDFISLGGLDRKAGATLRRLSNQLQSPRALANDIGDTKNILISVTQKRLIAQDSLREMPARLVSQPIGDFVSLFGNYEDTPALTDEDKKAYNDLYTERRDMLLRLSTMASTRITEIVELQAVQEDLLAKTDAMKTLLAEQLLWIPSVPAINFDWPKKFILGGLSILTFDSLQTLLNVLIEQIRALWPVVMIMLCAIFLIVTLRAGVWESIKARASKVKRIREDSYWHTPIVILQSLFVVLPLPLIFLTLWLLFKASASASPYVEAAEHSCFYLIFFALLFLIWHAWDKENSLFGAHYNLPKAFRQTVNKHLKWFIPVLGLLTISITFTQDHTDKNIYEGFGLGVFILTALALSNFGYQVFWQDREAYLSRFKDESAFLKYRVVLTLIIIGLPLIAAVLAAAGYYDTANELLSRIFLSGWVFLLTYVIFGLVRRTIMVAQRRLSLNQAIERRDAALRAHEEKLKAEEAGEDIPAPPPVDTSEINVKTMSLQSMRLLNTIVAIGFAVVMWFIWSDLLPALSVFNDVEIGSYRGQIIGDDGASMDVQIPITLWNLIQSAAILGLTFIAARNLPAFLEIFVLSRAGVDPGTRYAITTILGYIIVGAGVVIGFDRLGLQWSQLRWIVTGLSVGIGFGLQKIIANFISGLIILFERPVRIGDYVTIGDQSGIVSRIKIRATTLSDLDNREILIPNEALISERVTNWTLSNSVTRLTISVGIAYGSDTDKAREIMLDVLRSNSKVLETPAPQALFIGFGESSLDFDIRVFLRNFEDRWPVKHSLHTEINRALEAAGISIPFPQREVNIISKNK